MCIKAMPLFIVVKNINFRIFLLPNDLLQEIPDGRRMKKYPKRIEEIPELKILQLLPYVLNKTGTKQQDPRVVVDLRLFRLYGYFCSEVDR